MLLAALIPEKRQKVQMTTCATYGTCTLWEMAVMQLERPLSRLAQNLAETNMSRSRMLKHKRTFETGHTRNTCAAVRPGAQGARVSAEAGYPLLVRVTRLAAF